MRAILMALVLASILVPAPPPAGAAGCRFALGFEVIHDALPDVVGDCLVNEHYAADGGALQETTGGLLVWRKSDNFTAFTDGYRTWVNGPFGIQERLNTDRFEWEKDPIAEPTPTPSAAYIVRQYPQRNGTRIEEVTQWSDGRYTVRVVPAPPPCYLQLADVPFSNFVPNYIDGAAYATGSIHNSCQSPANVIVDLFAHNSKDGPPVVDAPSVYGTNIASGGTQAVTARIPTAVGAPWFSWRFFTASETTRCSDFAGSRCLTIDDWLASAYYYLSELPGMPALFNLAASNNVRIRRDSTQIGVLGSYSRATKTITIDTRLDSYSSWVRAAVMAHELQHAADDAAGMYPQSSDDCYRAEEEAYRREAQVWSELWKYSLPPDTDTVHAELNDIALSVSRDPVGFALSLIRRYGKQCE